MIFLLIFSIFCVIPTLICLYFIFEQAGRKGWEALVPGYNFWIWIKIANKPFWWMLLLLVPFINIFMVFLLLIELSVCFKRNAIWEYFSAAVLPFLYFPFLLFVKKEKYQDPRTLAPFKKGFFRDWFDAIVFAAIAAVIVRMFFFENYTIPTSSMEKSMLVGDYVYVSKLAYGPRIPQTPLSFPLVHHTLPFTSQTPSYIASVQAPYRRAFAYRKVQRGDAVVFNFPVGDTVCSLFQSQLDYYALCREYGRERILSDKINFGDILVRPVDKRENFVKRCVGIAGDTLQIIDRQIYINGLAAENPKDYQFNYQVLPHAMIASKHQWQSIGMSAEDIQSLFSYGQAPFSEEIRQKALQLPGVENLVAIGEGAGQWNPRIFPFDQRYPWNVDNFGPIYIPQKGARIALNLDILPLYQRIISVYENHQLEVRDSLIFIDGERADDYTFAMDYYWMMGDNRHNSADSRYWGFVPEDHIVGKSSFVWLSLDKDKSFPKNIRFNKMFRWIR